jgi:6-phosphofructokinase
MGENKNVVVAQSGGPTPVINNSLRSVIKNALTSRINLDPFR